MNQNQNFDNTAGAVAPAAPCSADFKPSPRWHKGIGQWVLAMEPQVKSYIYVMRADGVRHYAAVDPLYIEEPNNSALPPSVGSGGSSNDTKP